MLPGCTSSLHPVNQDNYWDNLQFVLCCFLMSFMGVLKLHLANVQIHLANFQISINLQFEVENSDDEWSVSKKCVIEI